MDTITKQLSERITSYLVAGGLVNPELANHAVVRDLLIDCRAALDALPVQQARQPLTDAQIEKLREKTFSTTNPFCPVDSKSMRKAVRAAEWEHGITGDEMSTERELFEAYYTQRWGAGFLGWLVAFGRYEWDATQEAWVVWQAARTQPTPPSQLKRLRDLVVDWQYDKDCPAKVVAEIDKMLATPPAQPEPPQGYKLLEDGKTAIPADWTPLRMEWEPGYPEDVAFGPQRAMDRLKKWLDAYFVMIQQRMDGEAQPAPVVPARFIAAANPARIARLLDRLEAAEADAGRYRWLRELLNADSLNVRFMGCDLDMVIDAAMQAKEPPA